MTTIPIPAMGRHPREDDASSILNRIVKDHGIYTGDKKVHCDIDFPSSPILITPTISITKTETITSQSTAYSCSANTTRRTTSSATPASVPTSTWANLTTPMTRSTLTWAQSPRSQTTPFPAPSAFSFTIRNSTTVGPSLSANQTSMFSNTSSTQVRPDPTVPSQGLTVLSSNSLVVPVEVSSVSHPVEQPVYSTALPLSSTASPLSSTALPGSSNGALPTVVCSPIVSAPTCSTTSSTPAAPLLYPSASSLVPSSRGVVTVEPVFVSSVRSLVPPSSSVVTVPLSFASSGSDLTPSSLTVAGSMPNHSQSSEVSSSVRSTPLITNSESETSGTSSNEFLPLRQSTVAALVSTTASAISPPAGPNEQAGTPTLPKTANEQPVLSFGTFKFSFGPILGPGPSRTIDSRGSIGSSKTIASFTAESVSSNVEAPPGGAPLHKTTMLAPEQISTAVFQTQLIDRQSGSSGSLVTDINGETQTAAPKSASRLGFPSLAVSSLPASSSEDTAPLTSTTTHVVHGSQTVVPGGSDIIVSSSGVSFAAGGSILTVGSETEQLVTQGTEQSAGFTFSRLDSGTAVPASTSIAATTRTSSLTAGQSTGQSSAQTAGAAAITERHATNTILTLLTILFVPMLCS